MTGKGRKRSKKKVIPKRPGSDGPAGVVPTPCSPSREAAGAAKVANRECITCDNCGVANPQKCCARCLCYYYCSKECQRAHWERHKLNCNDLKDERDHYNAARDRNNLPDGTPAVINGPCAICLEEEVKRPVTFGCGHAFCFECVFRYQCKEMKATCPYCRGEIPDVVEKACDRYTLYVRRAQVAGEGSEERKKYCDLAMAECDAFSQISKHPETLLCLKALVISLGKDPETLLKVTNEILSGRQSGYWELNQIRVVATKLWRAQAYSEMEEWIDASEIYSELRKEVQLSDGQNQFLIERGHCRCLFELGDYHEAVECGNRAVDMCREQAGGHEYLALAQKSAGNIAAAKNTMSKAILHEEQWNVENFKRNKQILRDL